MINSEEEYMEARRRTACLSARLLAGKGDARQAAERDALLGSMADYDAARHADRRGDWIPMASGKRYWPLDPRPGDVSIVDVAKGLAGVKRFNGRTRFPYSVAQHSVMVSDLLPGPLKLLGLLHDAAEAYLGDVVTPVKDLIRPLFDPLEAATMAAVHARYGLAELAADHAAAAEVKRADLLALATEARDVTLLGLATLARSLPCAPLPEPILYGWCEGEAESRFLARFEELYHG